MFDGLVDETNGDETIKDEMDTSSEVEDSEGFADRIENSEIGYADQIENSVDGFADRIKNSEDEEFLDRVKKSEVEDRGFTYRNQNCKVEDNSDCTDLKIKSEVRNTSDCTDRNNKCEVKVGKESVCQRNKSGIENRTDRRSIKRSLEHTDPTIVPEDSGMDSEMNKTSRLIFKCEHCKFECNKKEYLSIHMETHKEEIQKCEQCDFETKFPNHMEIHKRLHTGKIRECPYCVSPRYSSDIPSVLKHHMSMHNKKDFRLNPHRNIKSPVVLNTTNNNMHKEGTALKCFRCDFETVYSHHMQLHMQKHDPKKNIEQHNIIYRDNREGNKTDIRSVINKQIQQIKHLKRKRPVQIHELKKNASQMRSSGNLFRPNLVKCDRCEYETRFPLHLKSHMRLHSENKVEALAKVDSQMRTLKENSIVKCDKCSYETSFPLHLKTHMRLHAVKKS